ncbi:cytochrome aa3 quinol oxidase subunit II [Saliterribacillus persicus]|uniref:Quinol oxidase subunit 2 n=1 Tax=Saliterribacillus persicus TaxID=930114 RepID=A0A368XSY4_9BACI|nr:cytochrome aa3 quinol oxidase subunit II [Saliterribacillus persicus]RCW69627.1 cytochrome aa3 quinol oxidase subunit 2 [Saliterribacillus persicus]
MLKFKKGMYYLLLLSMPLFLAGCESKLVVFDPQGPIARSLTDLILFSIIFMAIIVLVVFLLFGVIVWKYRARPDNKDYEPPEEKGSHVLEIIWFVIPVLIVIALMIPTAITIYEVEDIPEGYEDQDPLVVHVTSADWKWIFSYPEQDIETVNYLNIPANRAIQFKMTSAGTMQSFWIPSLGGQKYTMANMQTNLFLVADKPGSYMGRNTSFNGKGYAHMEFEVLAQSPSDFDEWVEEVKNTADPLEEEKYAEILKPGVIGRMTFNNTHLDWIDHAHGGSDQYIDSELYRITHGDEEHEETDGHEDSENKEDTNEVETEEEADVHGDSGHDQ